MGPSQEKKHEEYHNGGGKVTVAIHHALGNPAAAAECIWWPSQEKKKEKRDTERVEKAKKFMQGLPNGVPKPLDENEINVQAMCMIWYDMI